MIVACVDHFRKLVRIFRFCAGICGADFGDRNYNPWNPLVFVTLSSIVFFTVCTVYTIYAGLVYDNDWTVILQCLCLASSAFQGYPDKNRECSDDRYEARRFPLHYNSYIACAISAPLSINFGKRLFIMRFFIPGLDPNSTMGYFLHMLIQFMCIFFGAFGNFSGDMFFIVLVLHVPLLKDIITEKLNELNRTQLKKRNKLLKDTFEWHQRCNLFIEDISELYSEIIFIEIFLCCLGICCTTFSIVLSLSAWPAAPAYLLFTLVAMYVYCVLGYTIEEASDTLLRNIYTECLWYELAVQQQQMILLMLIKAQSPVVLNIGKVMPLSLSSALQLTKAIYSFLMMLLNFLE
uniref:Odorant receptor n=1 Tax=Glossina morsitans morsitans TaxID=37546 RepID=A0A1B0FHP5_GLOMM